MKISIITPTYNSSKTVKDTLESIKIQTHKNIELIIVDGLSSDDTLKVVEEYKKYFYVKIISEKDKGIYDAMNKGVSLASGEIVHILNSDDLYFDENILTEVVNIFINNKNIDMVYGDIRYFELDINKTVRFWKAGEYREGNLKKGWIIPHPSLFIRNCFYQKIEKKFDLNLSIAADYEFILRCLKIEKAKVFYLEKTLISMRSGGVSNRLSSFMFWSWFQKIKAWQINGLKFPYFLIVNNYLTKISQVIFRNK